jgi:hypothetical protein
MAESGVAGGNDVVDAMCDVSRGFLRGLGNTAGLGSLNSQITKSFSSA